MDCFYYINQLYQLVGQQQQEINRLREVVGRLSKDVGTIKSRPPVTVGRLEYKFDQLKVETLEGTLNIGMNPAQLKEIEDLGISPGGPDFTFSDGMRGELAGKLNEYVDASLEELKGSGHQPELLDHMKKELENQIPLRVEHYASRPDFRNAGGEEEGKIQETLYRLIKEDIDEAIHSFLAEDH